MSEAPSLEQRLEFLEDQNEALKRSGLLLVILVILLGVTMILQSRSAARAVTTEGLILSTTSGKPHAALTTLPNGHLGFTFFDSVGQLPKQLQYSSIPYLDGFAIYDRSGRPRILIGLDDKENPMMATVSADGKVLFSTAPPSSAASQKTPPPSQPQPGATPAATPKP